MSSMELPQQNISNSALRRKKTIQMIREAILDSQDKKGASAQAIKKYILDNYPQMDYPFLRYLLRRVLIYGVRKGMLKRPPIYVYKGLIGRYHIGKKDPNKVMKSKRRRHGSRSSRGRRRR